jgi:hypothetical protein
MKSEQWQDWPDAATNLALGRPRLVFTTEPGEENPRNKSEHRNVVLRATLPMGCEQEEDLLTASFLSNHRSTATSVTSFGHWYLLELIPLVLRRLGLGRISQGRQLFQ